MDEKSSEECWTSEDDATLERYAGDIDGERMRSVMRGATEEMRRQVGPGCVESLRAFAAHMRDSGSDIDARLLSRRLTSLRVTSANSGFGSFTLSVPCIMRCR